MGARRLELFLHCCLVACAVRRAGAQHLPAPPRPSAKDALCVGVDRQFVRTGSHVCCAAQCGVCGGNNCAHAPVTDPKLKCCPTPIIRSGRYCHLADPGPCIIQKPGDPACSTGLLSADGIFCCPADCGACGVEDCVGRPNAYRRKCCARQDLGYHYRLCSGSLPPCLMRNTTKQRTPARSGLPASPSRGIAGVSGSGGPLPHGHPGAGVLSATRESSPGSAHGAALAGTVAGNASAAPPDTAHSVAGGARAGTAAHTSTAARAPQKAQRAQEPLLEEQQTARRTRGRHDGYRTAWLQHDEIAAPHAAVAGRNRSDSEGGPTWTAGSPGQEGGIRVPLPVLFLVLLCLPAFGFQQMVAMSRAEL